MVFYSLFYFCLLIVCDLPVKLPVKLKTQNPRKPFKYWIADCVLPVILPVKYEYTIKICFVEQVAYYNKLLFAIKNEKSTLNTLLIFRLYHGSYNSYVAYTLYDSAYTLFTHFTVYRTHFYTLFVLKYVRFYRDLYFFQSGSKQLFCSISAAFPTVHKVLSDKHNN